MPFTKVFYSNPGCETKCEDFLYSSESWNIGVGYPTKVDSAQIGDVENKLLA